MAETWTMPTVAHVFNVVGFAGSLRRGSYNRALLRAATELAPPALHIVIHDLDGIPLYNGDIEAAGVPPSARATTTSTRPSSLKSPRPIVPAATVPCSCDTDPGTSSSPNCSTRP